MKTYPNLNPTVSNGTLSLDVLLDKPRVVTRRLVDLTQSRFLGEVLLSGREQAPQGAVIVQLNDAPVAAIDDAGPAAPGAEAEVIRLGDGTEFIAISTDLFVAVEIVKSAARRFPSTNATRALQLISNMIVRQHETRCLRAIKDASGSGAFTGHTTAAGPEWTYSSNVQYSVFQAIEDMESREIGLSGSALVLDTSVAPVVLGNEKLAQAYAREDKANPIYTGNFHEVAGLPVLVSNRLNTVCGIKAAVVDTASLGGIATEVPLSGEVIDVKERRVLRVQAEKSDVPFVQEPLAIQAIDVAGDGDED